jgi:hypothetical protein
MPNKVFQKKQDLRVLIHYFSLLTLISFLFQALPPTTGHHLSAHALNPKIPTNRQFIPEANKSQPCEWKRSANKQTLGHRGRNKQEASGRESVEFWPYGQFVAQLQ